MHKFDLRIFTILLLLLLENGLANGQLQIPIVKLESKYHFKVSGKINQYDPDHFNLLINQNKFSLNKETQQQKFLNSTWTIQTKVQTVEAQADALDYRVTFKCINGELKNGSLSIAIDVNNWTDSNYVLLPAAAYNGNKYAWRRLRYSPKLYDIKDIGKDIPIIINDVPKLSESGGVSRIQERSGSMSTPSVGFVSNTHKTGIWMLTKQGNNLGDYGIDVEENRDRSVASFSVTSPVVREQYVYKICDSRVPSWDNPKNFKVGDEITITFRVYGFDAPKTQSLFDKFADIRKSFIADNTQVNTLPYSACMQTLEDKFNKSNFVASHGYYSVGLRENYMQDWQIGWTGGMISTYPLLFAGSKQTQNNVIRNFDWLFPNGISPSGFYWDAGEKGNIWYGGDIRNPQSKNWHLIRKSGDAVWYIIKQFMLMEKMGIPVKSTWKDGNQKVCDAFVKLWKNNHQLGQFINSETGDISVGGSSSGGIVPAALVLAASYYQNPVYLEVAQEIGNYFNANFTEKGIACGGPGDALQSFDSESAYGLVESYVALYESTKDKKWLSIAQDAAKQFATWVVSYNYEFPQNSAYHQLGIRTTGTVYANIQNKHAAPNICTASGLALLKLFRYTNDKFYLDLLKDIAHGNTQYMPHPKRPLKDLPFGYVSERINLSDWEGPNSIGYILPLSTWAETALMLTTVEIPGLYVQPDKDLYTAFDNIEVGLKSSDINKMVLQLKNTTAIEAKISILAERGKQAQDILEPNLLYGNKNFIVLQPNETKELTFKKNRDK